jgi:hypothetical protein
MSRFILILILCNSLAACVSVNSSEQVLLNEQEQSISVLVYRKSAMLAMFADVYVGDDSGYFTQLGRNEYTRIERPLGWQQLKARAQGGVASEQEFDFRKGETICLEARPNHEDVAALMVPFVNALVPSFVLKQTSCPDLEGLTLVE